MFVYDSFFNQTAEFNLTKVKDIAEVMIDFKKWKKLLLTPWKQNFTPYRACPSLAGLW